MNQLTDTTRGVVGVVVATLVLASVSLGWGISTAAAHSELVGSQPADTSTVAAPPPEVVLEFNQDIAATFATIVVQSEDGTDWSSGTAAVSGPRARTAVRAGAPAGRYSVNYRVVSADGHPITGSVTFTATTGSASTSSAAADSAAAPQPASTPPAAASQAPGAPSKPVSSVLWLMGAAVLGILVGGGIVAYRRFGPRSS